MIAYCRSRRIRLVTIGGAGGQIDPSRIRLADLRKTEQDPLLAKTRRLLRREYGFPSNPKRRFEVPAVWSDEPVRMPAAALVTCDLNGPEANSSLNCGGFGSVTPVTATFGMLAAAHVLSKLAGD